ncbi:hypothetical protein NWE61_05300 [Mycoplasmopsis felis]|uniref:hypothetical protein n=1 Tax=Mycoplasmopsis felis TaxID=33923 RepID=UPI0021E02B94|nr:hypothetical protein [Mycoplasmopsis felis]MCU9934501.1 hypothetical protein [Mycoplasmopsis felis]
MFNQSVFPINSGNTCSINSVVMLSFNKNKAIFLKLFLSINLNISWLLSNLFIKFVINVSNEPTFLLWISMSLTILINVSLLVDINVLFKILSR